jgi:hypothetical protein
LENAHYKLGNYGTGTLWYLRNRVGAFVLFNRLITKCEPDGTTWKALAPGWNVTTTAAAAARSIIRARPAVVNGEQRSLTNTKGDDGLSRWVRGPQLVAPRRGALPNGKPP